MDILDVRDHCLALPLVRETTPFGDGALVYKIGEKMFALLSIGSEKRDGREWVNLKCRPEEVIELCERYSEITPGFHMNKKHWVSVALSGELSNRLIGQLILNSYRLVVEGISPKARREELILMIEELNPSLFSLDLSVL